MSAISAAATGMTQAIARFTRASEALTRATVTDVEPIEPIADMIEAKHQFVANARSANIADEMTRQLLDIKV